MIDYHTHILPGMDDGSESTEESLKMLALLKEQGVDTVYLTSHFYINENLVDDFLTRRSEAFLELSKVVDESYPKLKLGAEVFYFEGIATDENIEKIKALRLEDTELLLLEMPFTKWTKRMIGDILKLQAASGIKVLMAHIERYLGWVDMQTLFFLRKSGVGFQMNAEYINAGLFRWRAKRLLNSGLISVIASDSHDMADRKPNMDLLKILEKK